MHLSKTKTDSSEGFYLFLVVNCVNCPEQLLQINLTFLRLKKKKKSMLGALRVRGGSWRTWTRNRQDLAGNMGQRKETSTSFSILRL